MRKVFPQLSIDWLCRWLHGLNFTHPAFGIDQHVFRGVRSRLDAVAEMNTIGFPLAIEWDSEDFAFRSFAEAEGSFVIGL